MLTWEEKGLQCIIIVYIARVKSVKREGIEGIERIVYWVLTDIYCV